MKRLPLPFRIREVVNAAERFLAQPEIYAALRGGLPNTNVFSVTIAEMLRARQLRRRKATKVVRAETRARHVYGPGPMPVFEGRSIADRPRKLRGFMEEARMREARTRRRSA